MRKSVFLAQALWALTPFFAWSQVPFPESKKWFQEVKFGVFIHWCLDGEGDHIKADEDQRAYIKIAKASASRFTASQYQPNLWAKHIKQWGAGYAVLTTKHHVGFALFDSPVSRFTAAKSSPAKRDLLQAYCHALRDEGIKVGLYYSLPDRSHPYYFSLKFKPDGKTIDTTRSNLALWQRFVADMHAEVAHLCKNYGRIDLFWFDGDWERTPEQWNSFGLVDTVMKYQPHAVINNRLRSIKLGEYATPEMVLPMKAPAGYEQFEFCTTLGYNWDGPDAHKYLKDKDMLIELLLHTVSLGGNLLLNVSPDNSGQISQAQLDSMATLGRWYQQYKHVITGSTAGLPLYCYAGHSVVKNGRLYLFVPPGRGGKIFLKNLHSQVVAARRVDNGASLSYGRLRDYHELDAKRRNLQYIQLDGNTSTETTVVEVEFENQTIKYYDDENRLIERR